MGRLVSSSAGAIALTLALTSAAGAMDSDGEKPLFDDREIVVGPRARPGAGPIAEIEVLPDAEIVLEAERRPEWRPDRAAVAPAERGLRLETPDYVVSIGGYLKVDVIHDFDAIGNRKRFVTRTIPVSGSASASDGPNTLVQANQTRFNLDGRTDLPFGRARMFFEMDFFSRENGPRLRHAFLDLGYLTGGQTWTSFADVSIIPVSLDFGLPPAVTLVRQPLARWTQPFGTAWTLAGSVEEAESDVTLPDAGSKPRTTIPDFHLRGRYEVDSWHAQLAMVLRSVGAEKSDGSSEETFAWGLGASSAFDLAPGDRVLARLAYGRGIGRYIQGLAGTGSAAAPDANGALEPLGALGAFVGLAHAWTDTLSSNAGYSYVHVDNSAGQAPDALRSTQYASTNLMWEFWTGAYVGMEFLYGTRTDKNGARGRARRLMFSAILDLG